MKNESVPDECPLCERPNYFPSDHHMVPRSRGGKATQTICADCHHAIHAMFTNKELEKEYNTVESLLAHEVFEKQIKFLRKQNPQTRMKMKRTNERARKKGRNG